MFSAWYYWIPKMIGLTYDLTLAKVQFWILFAGVKRKKKIFDRVPGMRRNLELLTLKFSGKRFYSQFSKDRTLVNPEEFILFFENIKENKKKIYQALRKKSGVYIFINNITNDLYVGSSVNLTQRMVRHYYNFNSPNPSRLIIVRAMKKYGLENFSLGIKEFCVQSPQICISLEQKWIDYYKPKYNILNTAGSSFGFKHSVETINKLKEKLAKENHPKFVRSGITSNETKTAISEGIKIYYLTNSHPSKGLKGKLSPQYGIGGTLVYCYNRIGEELIFPSINGAKQHFKVRWSNIKKNIDTGNWIILQGEEWLIQSKPRQK